MKAVKITMGVLIVVSIVLLLGLFQFEYHNSRTILAVGVVPYEVMTMVCMMYPPVSLVLICVITMIEKIRSGAKGKLLMIAGIIIFGAVSLFMGLVVNNLTDEASLIKTLKSPDGQHKVYYTEINLGSADFKIPGLRILYRTGMFTYEKQAVVPVAVQELIVWEDDGYYIDWGDGSPIDKHEYSSYGK